MMKCVPSIIIRTYLPPRHASAAFSYNPTSTDTTSGWEFKNGFLYIWLNNNIYGPTIDVGEMLLRVLISRLEFK